MEIKTITRNLNFDTESRQTTSPYRVKYNNPSEFKKLQIVISCEGSPSQVFETESLNLPKDKDSIHFKATKTPDGFIINWGGNAGDYMKRIK